VKVLWCTSEQPDLWSGSWRTTIPVRSCKIVKWACCYLPPPMATMPIQSCGALVNNRTSGLVLEGPQFNRSYRTLGYGTKLWSELVVFCPILRPLCRPAHPLMKPAYLEFNEALQYLFLKFFWRIIVKWAWRCWSPPKTTTSMWATPMQAMLILAMPTCLWNSLI